jgi:hypothetical protein
MLSNPLAFRLSPWRLGLLAVAALGAVGACSATGNNSSLFQSTTGSSAHTGAGNGGGQTGTGNGGLGIGGNGFAVGSGAGTTGTGNMGGSCAAMPFTGMQLPLDMYVMQDQSGSMSDMVMGGQTKWQAVTAAFTSFVQQPGLSGISMGLGYFALPANGMACGTSCVTDADCGPAACGPCFIGLCLGGTTAGDSCTPSDYATPSVEIAPLPGVGAQIISSLGMHGPSTSTPTGPALQGTLDHAKAWAVSHPGHIVIGVIATDGQPTECTPLDQAGIAAIAAAALAGTPSIKTFAIGVFAPADIPSGPNLLDAVAAAGGTGQAFNINTQMNVNQAFLDALNKIRGSALGCQYTIPLPKMGTPDFNKVNVQYTPGGGTPMNLLQYPDKAHCPANGDGWYYDNNANPMQIELCPATCTKVSNDSMGKIEVLLGCQTQKAQ